MPQGVIFDMDGVLVASGPAHSHSWRMLAKKHGIELTEAQFKESFGKPSRDIVREIWGQDVSDEDVRRIDEEKEAVYREIITGRAPLTIGVRETLARLQEAGFVLAVGTSGPPENVELVLGETRLTSAFAATVNGFDVKHGKPAPDIFQLAAERAGLQPTDCVVVEDAPVGVAAALAAGMKVIGYVGTHPAETLRDAGVHIVVNELPDITPELVRGLLR